MKSLILLAAFILAASAIPLENKSLHEPEPEGWFVPTGDGELEWMSKEQYKNEFTIFPLVKPESVKFYLYTKSNPSTPKRLFLNDDKVLISSNFSKSIATRVIIHGFQKDYKSEVNTVVRSALFQNGSYNVISVDWSELSKTIVYIRARNAVPGVGKLVAQFLDFLSKKCDTLFDNLILVGHSLGAHVAGFAGKHVTRGKVNIIIGLDPTYSLFSYWDCSSRLCSTDAYYVESIQTSGSFLGFLQPIGKAAFYPNGGELQPGCGVDVIGIRVCAHLRAYVYYAEAITRNSFKSIACPSYKDAVRKECGNTFSKVRMGTGYGNSGVFYVPINNRPPYGTG